MKSVYIEKFIQYLDVLFEGQKSCNNSVVIARAR
jgi:hypothetical protein